MEHHFNLSDREFAQQFENCSLDPALFTHEAHLRLAWIHVTQYGVETAILNVTKQLVQYVAFLGASAKYNHTLTIASVKAVNHFINKSSADTFKDFIAEFPRLKSNFKELINTHYSGDIFNSSLAKQEFIEPDLVPFD
ncbi:hypothetical protein [Salmonirosea aquatica]|uniref:Uncharacterized protein n=1 Tax=Salmonirosea aquatica TaxID=2654236 RepID=A0A7C9BG78_9BACT|nr:hypothetical protein [Cytophagaceae bacterium SJW1-29]